MFASHDAALRVEHEERGRVFADDERGRLVAKMGFFGRGFWRREREPEPELTKTERYTQREFEDAIAFAAEEWRKFLAYLRHLDPSLVERSLLGRLNVFAGPVNYELETRFPKITEVAEDMRKRVGTVDGKILLLGAIVKEGLVRAGEDRAELRKLIDEP